MNLKITLPACLSLAAFLGTMLVLNQSDGQQPDETNRVASASRAMTLDVAAGSKKEAINPLYSRGPLNPQQAKALLESYTANYRKPWQDYAESPHHMMSRVAPRPVPQLRTHIEWASSSEPERFMLATIRISKGLESTAAPCVIDRESKQVRIYANDQWQSAEDWVKSAPLPNKSALRVQMPE